MTLAPRCDEDVLCPECGKDNPTGSKYCGNCGANLLHEKSKKKGKLDTREYLAFGILLFMGYEAISSLLFTFSSSSVYLTLIKSSLDSIRENSGNSEVFERELRILEEYWFIIGFRGQLFALILAIVAFLIGIMVMRWINKMGALEGLKHILGCIAFIMIVFLVVNFISSLLL